jgi:hypothetical protein
MTGIDDLSGFWKPFSINATLTQGANSQGDEEESRSKSLQAGYAWVNAIDISICLSVCLAFLAETVCSSNIAFLEFSRNRAPPSC